MRHLHDFEDQALARRFADALYAEQIPTSVRESRKGGHAVWVEEDDDLDAAKAALAVFLDDPNDPRFQSLQKEAKEQRKAIAAEEKKSRHKEMKAREAFKKPAIGWLTGLFIGASVVITIIADRGHAPSARLFDFAKLYSYPGGPIDLVFSLQKTYLEDHEWWRLLTPMLLHLSWLHLLFNMWWLKDLGTAIEHQESSWKLLAMVLVVNLLACFGEFFIGSPRFGGFSGVVYGLFGYLWMRGRFDPTYPIRLPRSTVLWMMVWFILCFSGFMPIANTAHAVGLVVGGLWGFLQSGYIRRVWLRKN
ncbi:MAG: rhomboid family intramembrane serine protease [Deltaproteobacteria bacterium]|nr:rhomboid family intramembrane serine protease [Deltaproteobacteria bacterium]